MSARTRMAGIDLAFFVKSSDELIGRRIKRAYQLGKSAFSLLIHPDLDGRRELIVSLENAVLLSRYKWTKPQVPTSLAMGIRKWVSNARVIGFRQPGLERVVRLEYEREGSGEIIFELFGRGNLVVTDERGKIVQLARRSRMRDRSLARGEIYEPPPSRAVSPDLLDEESIILEMGADQETELWRFLIERVGVGPPYVDEILWKSGISASAKLSSLKTGEVQVIAGRTAGLLEKLDEPAEPVIYLSEGRPVDFAPFPLESLASKFVEKKAEDYLNLLEEYFLPIISDALLMVSERDLQRRIAAIEIELERQKHLLDEHEEKESELRRKADLLYSSLYRVQELIEVVRRGEQASSITQVNKKTHTATVEVQGALLEVDYLREATENASNYYERAKKLSRKRDGAKRALQELQERLNGMKSRAESTRTEKKPKERIRKRWFERFRWFFSSDGLLVLAGRDRATNRELVRRYLDEQDLFFHADLPGGAAVVVKLGERELGQATIEEAADFAASFSRAWKQGLAYSDVYYVRGDQVKVHGPPGTYLPKGSFYISGRRNYVKGQLRMAVGLWGLADGLRITSCPPGASKGLMESVVLSPGSEQKLETANRIKSRLERSLKKRKLDLYVEIDDIVRALPPGQFRILRERT